MSLCELQEDCLWFKKAPDIIKKVEKNTKQLEKIDNTIDKYVVCDPFRVYQI